MGSNLGPEILLPCDADAQTKPTPNSTTVPARLTLLGAPGPALLPSLTAPHSEASFQQKQHPPRRAATYPELLQLC